MGKFEMSLKNQEAMLVKQEASLGRMEASLGRMEASLGRMEASMNVQKEALSTLQQRFDAVGIGFALFITALAGSGNIVKVLEYLDKKEKEKTGV